MNLAFHEPGLRRGGSLWAVSFLLCISEIKQYGLQYNSQIIRSVWQMFCMYPIGD